MAVALNNTFLMRFQARKLPPLAERGPLRVMFVVTSMPIGGAEMLLVELLRRMDRRRFSPMLCCLKELGPLGEAVAGEAPTCAGLLKHKWDGFVLARLIRQMQSVDAVVTVGPGDKMFWGRLAAWFSGVPVICSALHSSGLPDHVEFPNRLLAPITDAFIAVAEAHAQYLIRHEGCPAKKVRVIHNGVDVERFRPLLPDEHLRIQLGLPATAPLVGIVAALRPEKNHALFLRAAALVRRQMPDARFLIVGAGPERLRLEALAEELSLGGAVRFLGARTDVPQLLALMDVLLLTSHMESNPLCLLEAMSAGKPVVAVRVGSIAEVVRDGETGFLTPPGDKEALAERTLQLLRDRNSATALGRSAREHVVKNWSIENTVHGYEALLAEIYSAKCSRSQASAAR